MNSLYNAASSFKECVSYAGKSIYYKVYDLNSFLEGQAKKIFSRKFFPSYYREFPKLQIK